MKTAFITAAALAAALAAPAQAALATDPGAFAPAATIDFEAYDGLLASGPEALDAQVVFTGDAGSQLGAFIADLGDNGLWGAGNRFAATGFVGELRFSFAEGRASSGAGARVNHFAAAPFPFAVVVSAYGANHQIIETHTVTVDTADDSLNEGLFLGIVRPQADIRSIAFKGNAIVLDDFAYVAPVPEPGAWAMLLAGLGAVGFVARRRSR